MNDWTLFFIIVGITTCAAQVIRLAEWIGGSQMSKKTRSQLRREREQAVFIVVTSVGILAMVAVILWNAVTG